MNRGTKIRTALMIAALVLAILAIFQVITGLFVKIAVSVFLVAVVFAVWYFNSDLTEAGCIGTGATRQIKKEQKPEYVGERFYTAGIEDMRMEVEHE